MASSLLLMVLLGLALVHAPAASAATKPVPRTPNKFLLFPNPQLQADGTLQTNSEAYAIAYYEAIDPLNQRDTFDKWKAVSGFGTTSATATEYAVTFGDILDLGYGRAMRIRHDSADNTVASYVDNYQVGGYSKANYNRQSLEAAIRAVRKFHLGTNVIEYSPGPNGGPNFVKFYNFDRNGRRNLMVDLDGRGPKAMPAVCANCHGGRADPLTPPGADGKPLFPLPQNTLSQTRGDIQGRLQALKVDSFDFSRKSGYTRAMQEAAMKAINRIVLCTYPIDPAATVHAEDQCRPVLGVNAGADEWQGAEAAKFIKAAYGGDGLPDADFADRYVPDSWVQFGQTTLYQKVVSPGCMTCHLMRGTARQSDIDFTDYAASFMPSGLADPSWGNYLHQTLKLVFADGNMPLAKIVADKFWGKDISGRMANFMSAAILEQDGATLALRDRAGKVIKPGNPVAVPGPDRVVRPGSVQLDGSNSPFTSVWEWSIVSAPGAASLSGEGSARPTFQAAANGTYVLQLVAKNGRLRSQPVQISIVVDSSLSYEPASLRFADVKTLLLGAGCTACHTGGGGAPMHFTDVDRNADAVTNATDDAWFHAELRGKVNFTDFEASPLLRKPSGHHHNGGQLAGFDNSLTPGAADRSGYDLLVNWIMNGAPYQ